MRKTNRYQIHPVVRAAIDNDDYNSGGSDITATGLIRPPRVHALYKRYPDKLVIDYANLMGALRGKMLHKLLEIAKVKNVIRERRLYTTINGWRVSAQFDMLSLDSARLTDWKSMEVWKYQLSKKEEFEQQLNVQAWLLAYGHDEQGNRACYHVEEIEAVAWLLDWKVKNYLKDPEHYPFTPTPVIPLKLWKLAETEQWMQHRVALHQAALAAKDEELPRCTPEERWEGATVYAVKRQGKKNALKGGLHASESEAQRFMAEQPNPQECFIEARPATPTRCVGGWCAASSFCSQYQSEIPAGLEGMALSA